MGQRCWPHGRWARQAKTRNRQKHENMFACPMLASPGAGRKNKLGWNVSIIRLVVPFLLHKKAILL